MPTEHQVGHQPEPLGAWAQPLAGIRVLDVTHVLAGPFTTRLLADLGADVLRVESSAHPESPWKSVRDQVLERDASHRVVNRNKRSVALNLKAEQGRALALHLAGASDVLVENFSAGVMERLGLGYPRVHEINPRLVYASMSGYGHEGPRRDWTSMNANLQAYSGQMLATGTQDDPPIAVSNSWMDYVGGLHAAFGIVEALARRAQNGRGCWLDLSQFECGVSSLGGLLLAAVAGGPSGERLGNRSGGAAPQGCYRCAGEDEWCTLSVQRDADWRALQAALGNPAWADDARFDTLAGRLRYQDEIDSHLEAWAVALPPAEAERRLKAAGVPAERMRRIKEVLGDADPSGVFERADDGGQAEVRFTRLPFSFERTERVPLRAVPKVGADTEEVLLEWLGLERAEVALLKQVGALA